MKTKKVLLGLILVLMPLFTACMCIGIIAISFDYTCTDGVLGNIASMGVWVLYGLSFLPIREIYKYTGWRDACVLSGIVNAVGIFSPIMVIFYPIIVFPPIILLILLSIISIIF
ncbi:iron transporter [Helicobacter cynogastricus]|uniref:iron transporter n=1 Tax=Helicobacter cynogastricus TaxID=329937 RepID=UPI000CF0AF1C|nr:iron transporter [Helicobacter cynogastricus]